DWAVLAEGMIQSVCAACGRCLACGVVPPPSECVAALQRLRCYGPPCCWRRLLGTLPLKQFLPEIPTFVTPNGLAGLEPICGRAARWETAPGPSTPVAKVELRGT